MNKLCLKLQKLYEIFFSLIMLLLIVGLVFPYGLPVFTPLVLLFFVIALMNNKVKLRLNIGITLLLLSVFAYIWGLFLNNGVIYNQNSSDLINVFILTLLLLSLSNLSNSEYQVIKFKAFLLISVATILVSLLSLYKFYLLLNGTRLDFLFNQDYYPAGTSLMSDYNMFSLGMLIGLISLTFLILNTKKLAVGYILLLSFIPVSLSVIFSSSRRGMLVLIILLCFLSILLLRKALILKYFRNKIFFLFIVVISLFLILFLDSKINIQISNSIFLENVLNRSLGVYDFVDSLSSRTVRWDSSLEIFGEYSILQVLFGNGFEYLYLLGNIFKPGYEEYPHNLILSTLLYSGVFGLIILVLLLLSVIIMGIINFKHIGIEVILIFIVCLTFMSVSGNSLFSSKLLGVIILMILCSPLQKTNHINIDKTMQVKSYSLESEK